MEFGIMKLFMKECLRGRKDLWHCPFRVCGQLIRE